VLLRLAAVAAELLPAKLDKPDVVLRPGEPYSLKVGLGMASLLRFSCRGSPADVVLTFTTLSHRNRKPLLFLWLNDDEPPTMENHITSSFEQWREDSMGSHYVRADGVGPDGGLVGVVNPAHWSGGEITGVLSLHCSVIIAFDTLFWDHFRDSYVCPLGLSSPESGAFCSGHGRCGKYGECQCDVSYMGRACESAKSDIFHTPKRRYSFDIETGKYQYFRVRVPPTFRGGFLQIHVKANQPLVVLVRKNKHPTKDSFQLSNFDDWINKRDSSRLKFKVMPGSTAAMASITALPGGSSEGSAKTPGELPPGATAEAGRNEVLDSALPAGREAACPDIIPKLVDPACGTVEVTVCQTRCMECIKCNNTKREDDHCAAACKECMAPGCISVLGACAASVSCSGPETEVCTSTCGGCMLCLDSNDELCQNCRCCQNCVPIAAKCGGLLPEAADNQFVYIGMLNHRRHYSVEEFIHADAEVWLQEDASFSREQIPVSWISNLYDPFHDIRTLELTESEKYPEDEQFMYHVQLHAGRALRKRLRLYRDRITLLALDNPGRNHRAELTFRAGPNVTHVLYSSKMAPKTLFDFDQIKVWGHHTARIVMDDRPRVWCALFGGVDGELQIMVRSKSASGDPNAQFALVGVPVLLFVLVLLGALCSNTKKSYPPAALSPTRELADPEASMHQARSAGLSERLANLVPSVLNSQRSSRSHGGTTPLNRGSSFSGYFSSETIPLSVEEQYLHRGGFGDDGM